MKANEFIKKYGVAEAKKVLHCMDDASEFKTYMPGDTWDKPTLIDAVGLRRLVESHELVETEGGLLNAKNSFQMERDCGGVDMTPFGRKLYQAILNVESCNVD